MIIPSSFTQRSDSILRRLITPVSVCTAFDPNNPPNELPKLVTIDGLWDTGASSSCISDDLANELGLITRGLEDVHHAGGISQRNTYIVNILLPNDVGFSGVPVFGADIREQGIDMLIGMDIITQGDFTFTNMDGKSCFSFRMPSSHTVDYVRESNDLVKRNVGRNDPCPCGSGKKFKNCHLPQM